MAGAYPFLGRRYGTRRSILSAASGILKPQDVFATSLYTGTGTARNIVTGLDMAGNGGLTWFKARDTGNDHYLFDTARGSSPYLQSDTANPEQTTANYTVSPLANGFTVGSGGALNGSGGSQVAWSFRRAPKFFDIVTYTGDGTSGRQIPHTLGIAPGMIIVKSRSSVSNWRVYHTAIGATQGLRLNDTSAQASVATVWNNTQPTSTTFTVGNQADVNTLGDQCVAYLFAHDPDTTNGVIQCGTFTTNGSGIASATLGWQPQFLMVKPSSATGNWTILDTSRGWTSGSDAVLNPNLPDAETSVDWGVPSSTGISLITPYGTTACVYIAIRAAY